MAESSSSEQSVGSAAGNEAARKILASTDPNRVHFSKEESEALRQMARIYVAFAELGRVGALVKRVVMYLGWAIFLYLAIKGNLIDWFKGQLP